MSRELMAVGFALLVAQAVGCLEAREQPAARHRSSCTTCHGSPVRGGDELMQSAPPYDLLGNTDPRAPGVGAHLAHLVADDTHGGVACSECHVVPEATDSPGHADSALPAELVFGAIAAAGGRQPRYDAERLRCADTHCHFDRAPVWNEVGTSEPRCERCHAMPPGPPHPASTACHLCHGEVIDAEGRFVAPARHVDGVVDVDDRCDGCHGTGPLGAPPPDRAGNTDPSFIGVGAHAVHLAGTVASRPVACEECHLVPAEVGSPGHLEPQAGAAVQAEVVFSGVALGAGRSPSWNRDVRRCADSWCHAPSGAGDSPRWTDAGSSGCQGCHGMPPPAPHPQMADCARCHGEVIDAAGVIVAPMRHVDGVVDAQLPSACHACHGDASSDAPPVDLAGHTANSFSGVGAHRAHLEGSGIARTLACSECHQVPAQVLAPGHVDTAGPAEVRFAGVARAFGATPSYDGVRCADSYCHGAEFVLGHASGGNATEPLWTVVDGSQKQCDSCHGLPPPPPHPAGPLFCSECHSTVGITLQILDPERHVDGVVDF